MQTHTILWYCKKTVRIDAESQAVQKNSLQIFLSNKYESLTKSLDFLKIFDVKLEKDSNYFDDYVLKYLKGTFMSNKAVNNYSFDIPIVKDFSDSTSSWKQTKTKMDK